MLDNYIINKSTLALIPVDENITEVIEKYITYKVKHSALEIIDESCKFYGSSFMGRCQSSKYLLGIKYKCPIIISEVKEITIFPTSSYKNNNAIWFSYNGIKNYYMENNLLKIIMVNDAEICVDISENVFANGFFKASRLMTIMKSKKY